MLLTIGLVLGIAKISSAASGVIWREGSNDFVSLLSIPTFSLANENFVKKIQELEHHNFHGAVLKAVYYEEPNLVSFVDNDTKMTGVCGELWNILADYLNFTLVPIKMESRNFGGRLANGSYDGILGLIHRNESQIVPRSGIFSDRLSLLQYTMPLWRVRYHLYIKPEWKHDDGWIFHLFSAQVWYSFFLLLLLMSVGAYIHEKNSLDKQGTTVTHHSLLDHVFHTIAIAMSQGATSSELEDKSKLIYLCTNMFSWLIIIAFSSHAIYLMMNKKSNLPFTDLKSLIQNSKYGVVAFSGSMVHQQFEETATKYYRGMRDFGRVTFASSAEEVYGKVCFSTKGKYAAFEAIDRHKAIGRNICRLVPTQSSYFETWIASAIKRRFRYRRSFDNGILRMYETGLLDGLKDRWLDWKVDENEELPFQSIDVTQTYLIFTILIVGCVLSVIVLMLEFVIFFRSKQTNKLEKFKIVKNRKSDVFLLAK
ncbi:uncharacterized protein LOC106638147 [Copidosoma floridanum]|uniref:uncharacterized protein LOC106638147 n=1 Tax=Copidosoma floridanum TaxID=29053 RepID=UPI000C6F6E30|nr:uncharacterized protein LOC106638147 [Copidosoma floridanum]